MDARKKDTIYGGRGDIIAPFYFSLKGVVCMSKRETDFQADLKLDIKKRFPGCQVFKIDGGKNGAPQGWPDLLILYNSRWAALECKKEKSAEHQPNQDLYIERISTHTYASFISPENKEEVLNDMARSFGLEVR